MTGPPDDRGEAVQIFLGHLTRARAAAWNPSAQWLSRQSGIPKSTVEALINGSRKRLPDWTDQIVPLLRAYRRRAEDEHRDPDAVLGGMTAWHQAYNDAQNGRSPACPLPAPPSPVPASPPPGAGRPVSRARPLELEVHPAIQVGAAGRGDLDELPVYIRRAHDEALTRVVEEARTGASQLVVLVGGSSTGKTRALWEAVRTLPEPWRLWHPIYPGRSEAVLAGLEAVGPRTVVWLNEAQHYLRTADPRVGEQVAAGLRELLRAPGRGPVLVAGTLWPEHWDALTGVPDRDEPDPHAQARDLLKNASVPVPDRFGDADLEAVAARAGTGGDPRLAEALRRASSGRLTQYLAGGPALVQRYDNAEPGARAILDAAIDLRRLGHGSALPRLLLEAVAPGYLGDEQWDLLDDDDWLERAFAYLTDRRPCRGARPPLSRSRPRPGAHAAPAAYGAGKPSYRLADYLEQHAGPSRRFEVPPEEFWTAAARRVTTAEDLEALSAAARDRLRYRHAADLALRAASLGRFGQLYRLADELEGNGNGDGAERLCRAGAEAGDTACAYRLAMIRERCGDHAEAERLAFAITGEDGAHVLERLVEHRWENGRRDLAERLAIRAFHAGHHEVLWYVARGLWHPDDRGGTARMYRAAADAGEVRALVPLAETTDDPGEADRLYRAAAEQGVLEALWAMAWKSEEAGDHEECERYARLAVAAEQSTFMLWDTLWHLVRRREERGDHQGAERLNAIAEGRGVSFLGWIAHLRMDTGDDAAAVSLAPGLAASGKTRTLGALSARREAADDFEGAEHLARMAFDAGDPEPLRALARLKERSGAVDDAERLYVLARDRGALRAKARRLERAGDVRGAVRVYRLGADLGDTLALHALARVRESEGDLDQAERLAVEAAEAGDARALRTLAWMRECRGDGPTAERLAVKAANHGATGALRALAVARERAGDRDGAESLACRAAGYGDAHTLAVLARLRLRGGARDQAERLYESAAEAGDPLAVRALAALCERTGDTERAERLARQAAAVGDRGALWDLARLREQAGKHGDAARLYRTLGAVDVLADMADRRARAGDLDGAERLALIAAELGDSDALLSVLRLRAMAGDRSGAERVADLLGDPRKLRLWSLFGTLAPQPDRHDLAELIASRIAEKGVPEPLEEVAVSVSRTDPVQAERLLRRAAEAGSVNALLQLANLREQAGDHAEAEQWARRLCEAGSSNHPIRRMAESRRERGDHPGAERLYRILVESGEITALLALTRLRLELGDEPGAEKTARQAADAGYSIPIVILARERAGHDVWQRLLHYGLEADGRVADPW
ncbi:hypothetical protein F5972_12370 [Microbispora cellulosiformans]|uniref:Tetratricopeptide repeat protein n=1 Tax=Microbispora cellulosiformans TaxID=2614688 RepID=A0A5J5K4R0_9ACTN|nr:hypothetical protein [Microbispora cellulosiformans]KAA9379012.1 hypothetical protein F5972_12370 [Microbispora cellulosiformans]